MNSLQLYAQSGELYAQSGELYDGDDDDDGDDDLFIYFQGILHPALDV